MVADTGNTRGTAGTGGTAGATRTGAGATGRAGAIYHLRASLATLVSIGASLAWNPASVVDLALATDAEGVDILNSDVLATLVEELDRELVTTPLALVVIVDDHVVVTHDFLVFLAINRGHGVITVTTQGPIPNGNLEDGLTTILAACFTDLDTGLALPIGPDVVVKAEVTLVEDILDFALLHVVFILAAGGVADLALVDGVLELGATPEVITAVTAALVIHDPTVEVPIGDKVDCKVGNGGD